MTSTNQTTSSTSTATSTGTSTAARATAGAPGPHGGVLDDTAKGLPFLRVVSLVGHFTSAVVDSERQGLIALVVAACQLGVKISSLEQQHTGILSRAGSIREPVANHDGWPRCASQLEGQQALFRPSACVYFG